MVLSVSRQGQVERVRRIHVKLTQALNPHEAQRNPMLSRG